MAEQSSCENTGIVQHQQVAGPKQVGQLAKRAMVDWGIARRQVQQARPVALRDGLLRDEARGQIVVEERHAEIVRQSVAQRESWGLYGRLAFAKPGDSVLDATAQSPYNSSDVSPGSFAGGIGMAQVKSL